MTKKAEFMASEDITDVYDVEMYNAPAKQKTDAEQKTDDLSNALREDQSAFATIHKEDNGRSIHVERLAADKYDMGQLLDYLQSTYGGGDYRVRVYANGKITANKLLAIAHKIKPSDAPHQTTGGDVAQVLQTIMGTITEQNRRMMEHFQSTQQSKADMLNEMMLYKQLFASDNNGQQNGLGQLRDTVSLLGELGINVGLPAQEDDEPKFGDILEKFTPVITAAMGQQNPAQPQPQNNPKSRDKMNPQNMMLKAGLNMLLSAASKKADPAHYAPMIVDQLPEAQITEFLTAPDAAQKLVKICPPIQKFPQWFDELAEHVKALIGMPSRFSELYEDEISDITGENMSDESGPDGETDPKIHS